jgi:hypothetical protein
MMFITMISEFDFRHPPANCVFAWTGEIRRNHLCLVVFIVEWAFMCVCLLPILDRRPEKFAFASRPLESSDAGFVAIILSQQSTVKKANQIKSNQIPFRDASAGRTIPKRTVAAAHNSHPA